MISVSSSCPKYLISVIVKPAPKRVRLVCFNLYIISFRNKESLNSCTSNTLEDYLHKPQINLQEELQQDRYREGYLKILLFLWECHICLRVFISLRILICFYLPIKSFPHSINTRFSRSSSSRLKMALLVD